MTESSQMGVSTQNILNYNLIITQIEGFGKINLHMFSEKCGNQSPAIF